VASKCTFPLTLALFIPFRLPLLLSCNPSSHGDVNGRHPNPTGPIGHGHLGCPQHSHTHQPSSILSEAISSSELSFCPGLLAAMQSPTPPSLDFFESLPAAPKNVWAIYGIVLKKKGIAKPKLYIGSGTAVAWGVRARFSEYDRGVLPILMETAMKEGHKIVSKGRLIHGPIPSPGDDPITRVTFIAI
jgi:hypothetical protein